MVAFRLVCPHNDRSPRRNLRQRLESLRRRASTRQVAIDSAEHDNHRSTPNAARARGRSNPPVALQAGDDLSEPMRRDFSVNLANRFAAT
jgi:hypothetical protein